MSKSSLNREMARRRVVNTASSVVRETVQSPVYTTPTDDQLANFVSALTAIPKFMVVVLLRNEDATKKKWLAKHKEMQDYANSLR